MKILTFFLFVIISFFSSAQVEEGNWYGVLSVMGQKSEVGISIKNRKIFVPPNEAQYNPIDSVFIENSAVKFFSSQIRLEYTGIFENDTIKGDWKQSGQSFPLYLYRREIKRPQTPIPPFAYYTEELTIENKNANLSLSGTLTLPAKDDKKYPVVVFITGSGPQNRDSEILKHKSFAVIADHLAKQGIGSFRYDDRGVGKSTGNYWESDLDDFQSDLDVIVRQLLERKEVEKLGLLGHSEGGIIAPRYASENKKNIDFVIMMAAPGIPIIEMMPMQRKLTLNASGKSDEEIEANEKVMTKVNDIVQSKSGEEKTKLLTKVMTDYAKELAMDEAQIDQFVKGQLFILDGAWYKSFIKITPGEYLKKVKSPTLVLQGGKDLQVPEKENIAGIKSSLKKHGFCGKEPAYAIFPNLNHLMQPAITGNTDEYGKIETTIDRQVLFQISEWIKELK